MAQRRRREGGRKHILEKMSDASTHFSVKESASGKWVEAKVLGGFVFALGFRLEVFSGYTVVVLTFHYLRLWIVVIVLSLSCCELPVLYTCWADRDGTMASVKRNLLSVCSVLHQVTSGVFLIASCYNFVWRLLDHLTHFTRPYHWMFAQYDRRISNMR